jgi:carnosine N-methyltransferase
LTWAFSDHPTLRSELQLKLHLATSEDRAIIRSSVRQLWRDWSKEGEEERNSCHIPVLTDLKTYLNKPNSEIRILIPGAGLCRLPFNLAALGYEVEANELSYHQILMTNFVLSQKGTQIFEPATTLLPHDASDPAELTARPDYEPDYRMYPWAFQFSNHLRHHDQFRAYRIPDVKPADLLDHPVLISDQDGLSLKAKRLSLNSKDFQYDYLSSSNAETFDAVATVFFVDCAPNVLDYIRTIHHVLKPGGIWVSIGPLLWSCYDNGPYGRREGDPDDDEAAKLRQLNGAVNSVTEVKAWDGKLEFALDEILELIPRMGFVLERFCKDGCDSSGYILNQKSMLQSVYRLGHLVARKA